MLDFALFFFCLCFCSDCMKHTFERFLHFPEANIYFLLTFPLFFPDIFILLSGSI